MFIQKIDQPRIVIAELAFCIYPQDQGSNNAIGMKPFARTDPSSEIRRMPLLSVNCDELYPNSLKAAIDYTVKQRANVLDNYVQQQRSYHSQTTAESALQNVFCERFSVGYKLYPFFNNWCDNYFNESDPEVRRTELRTLLEKAIYQRMIGMMNLQSDSKAQILQQFCNQPHIQALRDSKVVEATEKVRQSTQNALNSEFISPEI